jgi:hypothetical protein
MNISSRTPEGSPNRCLVCGHEVWIEPSENAAQRPDAPCPNCGGLLWFEEGSVREVGLPPAEPNSIRRWLKQVADTPRQFMRATPIELYQQLIAALVEYFDATGGAIWIQDRKSFEVHSMTLIDRDWLRDNGLLGDSHKRLLQSTSEQQGVVVVPPLGSRSFGRDAENPSQSLLFCRHVQRRSRTREEFGTMNYVMEIFQRPDLDEDHCQKQRDTLDLLTRFAG